MKVVWLCYYSLHYLKEDIDTQIESSFFHPATWMHYLDSEIQSRQGIDLHLITISPAVDKDYVIRKNNVTYYIIKNSIKRFAQHLPLHIFQSAYHFFEPYVINTFLKHKVMKIIDEIKPDVVNLHGTEGEFGTILNDIKFPSVIWVQGLMTQVVKIDKNLKYKFRLKSEEELLKQQKNFITIAGSMENLISDYNPGANYFNLFHPNSEQVFEIKKLNPEKNADIVFVGQIVKRKGVSDFVEVVKILKKDFPSIKAKIIGYGGGIYKQVILEKIKSCGLSENINFVGFLPDYEDVLMEVKKSRLFVLPTMVDTGPRSVAESMTIGVPVVSYNIGGLPSMINDKVSGRLVEPGNVVMLSEVISELLSNPEKLNQYAGEAYKFAEKSFRASKVVDELLRIYSTISSDKNQIVRSKKLTMYNLFSLLELSELLAAHI
ncbi:MAG: glycosyltransferase family 4 protein [Ignavibacteriales bacterium]|nr:MAG: glycosyltransferase family 4 protein [Ignavibacteriales bacterium]